MPQNVHFEHAAAMFELKYHRPQNWQELETAFADAWRTPTTTVIEWWLTTPMVRKRSSNFWRR